MKKIKPCVKLLEATPRMVNAIGLAASTCYSGKSVEENYLNLTNQKQRDKVITECIKMGHDSILEHGSISFTISGVSRALSHQLVRHRIASYSQQSQRYVTYDDIDVVVPPTISANEQTDKEFKELIINIEAMYKNLIACGVPAEDARYILPNATSTTLVVTMNIRSWRHFFNLRCCNRAQWEIRYIAQEMFKTCRNKWPVLFTNCGPDCLIGSCRQGKKACGNPWKK